MKIQKVLGTSFTGNFDISKKLKTAGYNRSHNQFRIVCKCSSMAEANRKCESAGLGSKVFTTAFSSETINEKELEMCENTDIAICIDGTYGSHYISIEDLMKL